MDCGTHAVGVTIVRTFNTLCHSRESGERSDREVNPRPERAAIAAWCIKEAADPWMPAFAGMTHMGYYEAGVST